MTESVAKVVLAYSGGLDTSVILRWLQDRYRCQVVTFTADLGQGEASPRLGLGFALGLFVERIVVLVIVVVVVVRHRVAEV